MMNESQSKEAKKCNYGDKTYALRCWSVCPYCNSVPPGLPTLSIPFCYKNTDGKEFNFSGSTATWSLLIWKSFGRTHQTHTFNNITNWYFIIKDILLIKTNQILQEIPDLPKPMWN